MTAARGDDGGERDAQDHRGDGKLHRGGTGLTGPRLDFLSDPGIYSGVDLRAKSLCEGFNDSFVVFRTQVTMNFRCCPQLVRRNP